MAAARNTEVTDAICSAAIGALAEINPPGATDFLIKIVSDSSYSQRLRSVAAVAARRTIGKINTIA